MNRTNNIESVVRDPWLIKQCELHPYPLLFVTISGAHLYGFPSPDSDFDLRGVHLLPLKEVVGIKSRTETVEKDGVHDGLEIDLVTHDIEKFARMMIRRNGYVLEQLLSPLIVASTPEFANLKDLAPQCITKNHAHHYFGFAATQWRLFEKDNPPRVKPLLYVFRVLLTGIHMMKTGTVEANLVRLNEDAKLNYIDELIDQKLSGPEKGTLTEPQLAFFKTEYERLVKELEMAFHATHLPEVPSCVEELNDLVVSVRMKGVL